MALFEFLSGVLHQDMIGGQVSFTAPPPQWLVNIQSLTAPVLKLFWKAVLRKQHYFLYNSGPQAMSLTENSAPGSSTKGNVPEETSKACVSFLFPLILYPQDTPIFGTPLCRGCYHLSWGSPEDGGWSWEIGDIWCPGDHAKFFQPRGSTIFWVK